MPSLRLTYFNAAGRAEPIRLALRIGGLAFEDVRLDFPGFGAAKASGALPLGSVPMLEIDGQKIVQTAAILRYAAQAGDRSLYPTEPLAALRVDSALDSLNDTLSHAMTPSFFERDQAKKLAMRAELASGVMARVFAYVDGLIAAAGGVFVGGDALSIADLVIALQVDQIRSGHLDGITLEHLAATPRLIALTDAVFADPRVVAARA